MRRYADPLSRVKVRTLARKMAFTEYLEIADSPEVEAVYDQRRVGYVYGFLDGVKYALSQIESGKSAVTIRKEGKL